MNELKTCPFCGAQAKLEKHGEVYRIKVRHLNDCLLHEIKISGTFGWEAIVRKWNRRAE